MANTDKYIEILCNRIDLVNSFLSDHKEYGVKNFEVTVLNGNPYVTGYLSKLDEKRDYNLHFSLTSRTKEYFSTQEASEDGCAVMAKTFILLNNLKYAILYKTPIKESEIIPETNIESEPKQQTDKTTSAGSNSNIDIIINKESNTASFIVKTPEEIDEVVELETDEFASDTSDNESGKRRGRHKR